MDIKGIPPLATPGVHDELPVGVTLRRTFNLHWSDLSSLLQETLSNFFAHNVPRLGASVAFYTLLSLAPLLIIVVAIAGAVFGREAATGQLVWQIQGLIGRQGAEIVQALLRATYQHESGAIATILGVGTLLYGASSVVAELRDALNTIWCVPKKTHTGIRAITEMVKDRTFAFGVVMGIGFLLLVSLTVSAALNALSENFSAALPIPGWTLQLVDFVFSYLVTTLLFAVIYKVLPDLTIEWRDVIIGATLTSMLFGIGKTVIGIYLGRATIASTYGAAGSLVVLLVWVYYSAQIFFLGAEFTQSYAQHFGSRPCDRIGREVKIVRNLNEAPAGNEHPEGGPKVTLT